MATSPTASTASYGSGRSSQAPSSAPALYTTQAGFELLKGRIKTHHSGLAWEHFKSLYGDTKDTLARCASTQAPVHMEVIKNPPDKRGRTYTEIVASSNHTFPTTCTGTGGDATQPFITKWRYDWVSPPQCFEHPDRVQPGMVNPKVDAQTPRRGSDAQQSTVDQRWKQWHAGAFP